MSDADELKHKLATAVQILRWELADMWGHVSCRSPRGDSFLIMPMRPPFDPNLPEDEILEYDFDGKKISGRRDPPAEIFFFTSLFRKTSGDGRGHSLPSTGGGFADRNGEEDRADPSAFHQVRQGSPGEPVALRYLL